MYAEYRSLGFFPRGYKESVFKQINTLNLHFGNITLKAVQSLSEGAGKTGGKVTLQITTVDQGKMRGWAFSTTIVVHEEKRNTRQRNLIKPPDLLIKREERGRENAFDNHVNRIGQIQNLKILQNNEPVSSTYKWHGEKNRLGARTVTDLKGPERYINQMQCVLDLVWILI